MVLYVDEVFVVFFFWCVPEVVEVGFVQDGCVLVVCDVVVEF